MAIIAFGATSDRAPVCRGAWPDGGQAPPCDRQHVIRAQRADGLEFEYPNDEGRTTEITAI